MKILFSIILVMLVVSITLRGQDGSNILYVPVANLKNSYIRDFVHLDFYNKSFRGNTLDTVTIRIEDNPVRFVERRKDNGLNNWFREQYLESVDTVDGYRLRIIKSRLNKITTDSVFVTNYLEYSKDNKIEKKREIDYRYPRSIIAIVLVNDANHRRK